MLLHRERKMMTEKTAYEGASSSISDVNFWSGTLSY
jgi:hypothetical protein